MQDTVIGLDVDRVLFDTNAYKAKLRERMGQAGLDYGLLSEKARIGDRTDIGNLFDAAASLIGEDRAGTMFFDGIEKYCSPEMRTVIQELQARNAKLLIVTVGDGHQTKKIRGYGVEMVFVVQDDGEKTIIMSRLLNSFSNVFFFDDKPDVVLDMRAAGINAFQASWFLDPAHRSGALKDSINKPAELLRVCGLD